MVDFYGAIVSLAIFSIVLALVIPAIQWYLNKYAGDREVPKRQAVEQLFPMLNVTPIIGILTQPKFLGTYDQYVMTAYVKFIEQGGAKAVAVCWDWDAEYLKWFVSQLNGIVLPGGDQDLISPQDDLTEFCQKIKVVMDTVKELNRNRNYFPVWAVCQGFQAVAL